MIIQDESSILFGEFYYVDTDSGDTPTFHFVCF